MTKTKLNTDEEKALFHFAHSIILTIHICYCDINELFAATTDISPILDHENEFLLGISIEFDKNGVCLDVEIGLDLGINYLITDDTCTLSEGTTKIKGLNDIFDRFYGLQK